MKRNVKVGDLVWCPGLETTPRQESYVGLVINICGYKLTVLGGNVVSWDGIPGRTTWDMSDIHLIISTKQAASPS